jgi:hypothetical protein
MLFGPLVGLIVAGPDRPVAGIVRHFSDEGERFERVRRDGYRVRVESLDGEVHTIVGSTGSWHFYREEGPGRQPIYTALNSRSFRGPLGGLDVGGARGSWERWDGSDFTRPADTVEPTTFLGRSAWTVELAPPSHKPHPLRITVDAETGMILRKWNEGFGSGEEWTEVSFGVDLADVLFTWDGPAITHETLRAERDAEHERDMAQRSQWLVERGFVDLPLLAHGRLQLHDWDDEAGTLYASVNFDGFGTLIRRAASSTPWEEPGTANAPHRYRWTDARWDWFYASDTELSADQLAALKAALSRTT